jgi:hypothetical protein
MVVMGDDIEAGFPLRTAFPVPMVGPHAPPLPSERFDVSGMGAAPSAATASGGNEDSIVLINVKLLYSLDQMNHNEDSLFRSMHHE